MMRSGVRRALAGAYRLTTRRVDPASDETVEVRPGVVVPRFVAAWSESGSREAQALLQQFPVAIDPQGRSVVTIGRGAGDMALEVARRGAAEVIAVDMAPRRLKLSRIKLEEASKPLPVDFLNYSTGLRELADRRFGLVIAADAFRDYGAEASSRHVEQRAVEMSRLLDEDGRLAIGLGPTWKAPFGGGIDSRLPWAHLIFPEEVIFGEHRRVRAGNRARTFDDVGVNRMTLERFLRAMAATGLVCSHLETNVGDGRGPRMARRLSRARPLREYFIQNVFGVWRRS